MHCSSGLSSIVHGHPDATGGRMLTGIIIFIVHKLSMNIHSGPSQNPQVLRPCPVYITEPYQPHTIFCCISRKYSIIQFLGSLVFKLGLTANITNSKQGRSLPASCTLPTSPKIACVSRVHASVSM